MTARERQEEVVSDYGVIEDPLERFQVIVETARGVELPEGFRRDEYLVPGCTSQVWLGVWGETGTVQVAIDSDAPALRGVGALFSKIYSGATSAEIREVEPDFIQALAIDRQLTPTRRRGLANIRNRLVEIVEQLD